MFIIIGHKSSPLYSQSTIESFGLFSTLSLGRSAALSRVPQEQSLRQDSGHVIYWGVSSGERKWRKQEMVRKMCVWPQADPTGQFKSMNGTKELVLPWGLCTPFAKSCKGYRRGSPMSLSTRKEQFSGERGICEPLELNTAAREMETSTW